MSEEKKERKSMFSGRTLWWAGALLGLPGLFGATTFWAVGGFPGPVEQDAPVLEGDWGEASPPPPDGAFKVVTWNIHYGVGPEDDFEARVPKQQVEQTLEGIIEVLKANNPDVVLLQEVDFDSARTYGIDQMRAIARGLNLRYMVPTVTWKKGYLPFPYWPISRQYGHMNSGQAILSRYPVSKTRQLRLPKPRSNPWYYNLFYLDRHITMAELKIGKAFVHAFNVHLEAFDAPNRMIHAEKLLDFYRQQAGYLDIVAGDFNSVPPNATLKHAFPDEPDQDMRQDQTITIASLMELKEIVSKQEYQADEAKYFTFPSLDPNRRLDYLWHSDRLKLVEGRIMHEAGTWSDHLPVAARFEWTMK